METMEISNGKVVQSAFLPASLQLGNVGGDKNLVARLFFLPRLATVRDVFSIQVQAQLMYIVGRDAESHR